MTSRGVPAKLLEHGGKVDISAWDTEASEDEQRFGDLLEQIESLIEAFRAKDFRSRLRERIAATASEALEIATTRYGAIAYFPSEWNLGGDDQSDGMGRRTPDDHTTLYITLPLGMGEDEGPTWAVSLRDVVEHLVYSISNDGKEGEELIGVMHVRDALRELAQMIDDALSKAT